MLKVQAMLRVGVGVALTPACSAWQCVVAGNGIDAIEPSIVSGQGAAMPRRSLDCAASTVLGQAPKEP